MNTPPTAFRRALAILFPALLAPAQWLLVGPFTVYHHNRGEFVEPFSVSLAYLLPLTLIGWTGLVALGAVLRGRGYRIYMALLLALGLACWIQGQLLVADYGLLDGQGIDWQRQAGRTPIELAMWLGVPIILLLAGRRILEIAPFTSGVLLLLQVGWIGLSQGSAPPAADTSTAWSEPPPEIFQLSDQQNVIHLVLDAFQSDVLAQILEEEPYVWQPHFDGFTFFTDHAGAFPTTVMSLPAMLSGEEYRNEIPILEFTRAVLNRQSVLGKLSQHGYEIDVATIAPRYSQNDADHFFRVAAPFVSQELYRRSTAAYLADLSLFRHAPHLLKPRIYNDQNWLLRARFSFRDRQFHPGNGNAFLAEWTSRLERQPRPPVYKHVHVGLPHLPVVLDRDCNFLGVVKPDRAAYAEQCRCTLKRLADFLQRLRDLGAYERSLILITSDHGTRNPPRGFVAKANGEDWNTTAGTAMALLLVKPPSASGALKFSSAPTSISDIPATIMDLLDLPHDAIGIPAFRLDTETPRTRTFGDYTWFRERWKAPYFDALHLLKINGRIDDGNSWSYQETRFPPGVDLTDRTIDLGSADHRKYLGPGWSPAERDPKTGQSFAWAIGQHSRFFAALPAEESQLRLRFSVPAFLQPQTITVRLNGQPLGSIRPTQDTEFEDASIALPSDPARPPISTFELSFSTSEQAPGQSEDARRLSAQFDTFQFGF